MQEGKLQLEDSRYLREHRKKIMYLNNFSLCNLHSVVAEVL
jgi:hypothetical protein